MTYIKGGVIQASDYDGLLTTVSDIYGVGTSDRGYGQTTITQAAVSIGDAILSTQWTKLRSMLTLCASQQGTAVTNLPPSGQFAVGHGVFAHKQAAPSSNAYELPNYVTDIDTNRLNVSMTSLSVATDVFSATRSSSWTTTIDCEVSVVWASEDAARYYFNSGGQIRLTGSQPSGTDQDDEWNSTLTNGVGTVKFAAHATTNTGWISGGTSIGFYELTDVYQNVYVGSVAGGSTYSGDNVTIAAKRLNHVGLHGGNGNGVQFKITILDTGFYYTALTSAGMSFSFDNVKATTFLTGIASPVYTLVSGF